MTHYDVPAESRISDLRHGLLTHRVVARRIRHLARLRIEARSSLPARGAYLAATWQTACELAPYFSYGELDYFARVWWSRRRNRTWALAIPVGGRERYGRTGQRARSVQPSTVRLAVEAIAHQLDPSHAIPGADYMDPSAPRQARRRVRELL
jgi:hypothetical protein